MLPSERGVILSGTDLSKEIRKSLASRVDSLKSKLSNYTPALAIVQVGEREDSNVYIRMKIKAANEIGINATHIKLPQTTTERELLNQLSKLNNDPNTHGIIVQMPLDSVSKINSYLITDSVIPEKDVDGLNTINQGKIAIDDMTGFLPCTPNGCIELIKNSSVPISGARAVVLGRSKIVGTPVAELLKWHNATVTICHSQTINLPEIVSQADILVVGIGQPKLVKGSWIKPGAVVIDCGINAIPDPTKKSGQRLVGDVDYEEAVKIASYITPVPGGVGPMTVAMLMQNTIISAERAIEKLLNPKWNIQVLQIHPLKPVPNDDAISGSLEPKPIISLAEEIGLFPSEFRPYGSKMAKVGLNVLNRLKDQANGKLVVVVGITPTVLGEGKSTTALGLVQALTTHKGINSLVTLRQHSQARIFKVVGSSNSGGGYSQVIPMEEFRLHLTGDIHALCIAKTPFSLTGDASIKGAPLGFTLIIKDILVSVGAGFVIPVIGDIILMPGLSVRPNIYDMDWNCETNEIEGLF